MENKISYILITLSIIGILLLIFYSRSNNSNIIQENLILKEQLKQKDSIIKQHEQNIHNLDLKIDSILNIQIDSRNNYKTYPVYKYNSYQIDSFFKNRYK